MQVSSGQLHETKMSKRPLDEGGSSSAPPAKNLKVQFEPIQLGSISTLDEMDMKTLRFQNHKLYQVIVSRENNVVN